MIAIQSLYTLSDTISDLNYKFIAVSWDMLKNHFPADEFRFYTNKPELLPDNIDNVYILNDNYKSQFESGWWQIYKQFLYTQFDVDFCHVDSDLIFKTDIDLSTKYGVLCEMLRGNDTNNGVLESMNMQKSKMLACSGIMGSLGNNQSLFNDCLSTTLSFIEYCNRKPADSWRWSLEEGVIYNYCNERKIQINPIANNSINDFFVHCQGREKNFNSSIHKYINELYNKL